MDTTCPDPGIFTGVPLDEYLAWDAVSNSRLALAKLSMAHYHAATVAPASDAMRFGSLVHSGRLEPLKIPLMYVVLPDFTDQVKRKDGTDYDKPKATAAYKKLVAEFQAANEGKQIVDQETYDRLVGVVTALSEHERTHAYLNCMGPVEVSIVWDDPATGLRCKARLDKWDTEQCRIADLKTTREANRFETHIARYSYHRQGAFYRYGLRVLTEKDHEYCIVAAETSEPYGVRAAPMSEEALEVGRDEFNGLLRQIAACKEADSWPGYESPDAWRLPAWAVPDEPAVLNVGGVALAL